MSQTSSGSAPTTFEACVPCTAGSACPGGIGDHADAANPLDCEPGHYCPNESNHQGNQVGAMHVRQYPCDAGTYMPSEATDKSAKSFCLTCDAGYYCP